MKNEINQIKKVEINNNDMIDLINSTINNILNESNKFQDLNKDQHNEKNNLYEFYSPLFYKKYVLSHKLDDFLSKLAKTKIFSKKISRTFEYFNKLIISRKEIKCKYLDPITDDVSFNIIKISLYIIKNNIITGNHLLNEKIFKILITMAYCEIIQIENLLAIIDILLNSTISKIINDGIVIDSPALFNSCSINFINDLFEALINIPLKLINDDIHIKLINGLISILDKNLFSCPFNFELHKLQIWFKLLGNKIINLDKHFPLLYEKIISFLVKIYKFNFQNLYYFQNFYEKSAVSFDYYINSLDFLCALFKEEEKSRTSPEFKIINGFYIYNNIPLTLDKIKLKLNAYSLIFSFKLTKIENHNENVILFSLETEENKNIFKFVINKKDFVLKIIDAKNYEWDTKIVINLNKDYLICFTQEIKILGKITNIFINNVVIKNISDNNEKLCNNYSNKSIAFPDFEQNMKLELGANNFEGIFGEVLLINKIIKVENINRLYNLKENYADIISSINYKNDFTLKNKKYTNENDDIKYFNNLKYKCELMILTNQIHSFLNNSSSVTVSRFGKLKYTKNKSNTNNTSNNELNIRLFSLNYSIVNFPYQHGIEYLIFQLHKIISSSEDDELLNFYLYKTLYFVLEYIQMASYYIFPKRDNTYKVKTEIKYSVLVLSLIIVLNTSQRELQLDEKIRELLIEFSKIYREKKVFILEKMNYSILLDEKIFKKGNYQIYNKILDELLLHINMNIPDKESSLLYSEILYKFLLLDHILESKEMKHKKYMEIISHFIIGNKQISKDEKKIKNKDVKLMSKIFIRYFIELKSPKKIYHYLKIIYLNIDSNKYYKENDDFIKYIVSNFNKIINDNYNCKYCQNVQILCFLINDIILKNEVFSYIPYGFMKTPNYKFIRCIFINSFNISNKIKLQFIKSSLYYENDLELLKHFLQKNNIKIFSLFNVNNFVQKLNTIIKYFYFLYNQYLDTEDKNLKLLLIKSIKLILDFLDEIKNTEEFNSAKLSQNFNDDSINQNKGNKANKGNTRLPNQNEISIYKFINDLFSSSGMKLLFILYFNVYNESELKDLKIIENYINISIGRIYNPFYLYLLLPSINLSNDIKKSNYYKKEILDILINNIISMNENIKKGNINDIFILNSLIVLIRIYYIISNKSYLLITPKLENNIINYLNYLLENNFLYCKYIFDINLSDEDVTKNEQNQNQKSLKKSSTNKKDRKDSNSSVNENKINKFLPEIVLDVLFNLLEKKESPELTSKIIDYLKLNESNSIFYKIEEYYFLENNNNKNISSYKRNIINLLNSPKISTDYCKGSYLNTILYPIYFLVCFVNKQKKFLSENEDEEEESEKQILINKGLEILFKDCLNIFKAYAKKLKKYKGNFTSEITFKIYDLFYENFSSKYKDTNFNFVDADKIYLYFIKIVECPKIINARMKRDHKLSMFGPNRSQSNLNEISISIQRSKNRKETHIANPNVIEKIKKKAEENKNEREEIKSIFEIGRQRSSSQNIRSNLQETTVINENLIVNNKFELKLRLYNDPNNLNNNNKKKNEDEALTNENSLYENTTSTSAVALKESKKESEHSESNYAKDIPTANNIINIVDSSDESDSDNSLSDKLNFNSNYNLINKRTKYNSINIIEEEKSNEKSSNKLYLHKNSSSSKNLKNNILSPNKVFKFEDNITNQKTPNTDFKKTSKFLPINLENHIFSDFNVEELDEKEKEEEHKFLNDKLKEIDIPNYYYRTLVQNNEPKWIRIIFNPKREIFKIFGFCFKNYIFNNKRFDKLKNAFNIKYKNIELEKSIPEEEYYCLKYPSKLKNFTCGEYYKPFLKPMTNFFENEYFINSHSYIKKEVINNDIDEEDKFRKINYEKFILLIKDNKKKSEDLKIKVKCENIYNKGSIYGTIYFGSYLMIFKDKSNKDDRLSNDIPLKKKLFFLLSSDETDRLKDRKKYLIIYYSEIREIVLRKFCFSEIAYEIFMKDGRSYFFNFYTIKNRKEFYDSLEMKIKLLNISLKNEESEESGTNIYYRYDQDYVDISFINDPKSDFEKKQYALKYSKKEISNFDYLLLVNKYSSRSYNDLSQYLIFPLLYMDLNKTKSRDLSKAICLNKDLTEKDMAKFKSNFESMGYYFNNHYTAMAYVLYYLMRIIPFTFSQIKLQSGHFDVATRMFTSLDNLLYVFGFTEENRELVPEFFYSYESFLNLNYNNFGHSNQMQIHHFNTNQNCGIIEFIIDLRKILEKKELSPWINNIFGCNQINEEYKSPNKFPDYSYEQYNDFKKEKEEIMSEIDEDEIKPNIRKKVDKQIKDIRGKIQLLTLGLTPSQLFKNPHPTKEKKHKRENSNNISNNSNKLNKIMGRRKSNSLHINKYLIEFINKYTFKDLLFIFNNNDHEDLKIIFLYKKEINIFNFVAESEKDNINIKINFEDELNIIKMKPYKNIFVELFDNVFLLCRFTNRTILLFSETQKIYIEWPCIITAIEFYKHNEIQHLNKIININKVIIGDEEGNLSLIEIEIEYNEKKKDFKLNSLSNIYKRHKTFYSYINAIKYNKRLNIIISSCNEGLISINNGFSFEIINLIEINNKPTILEYKISKYDLLYIYTYNNNKYDLYCYTLNGIKISQLSSIKEYALHFINDNFLVTIFKDGTINQYNCATLKNIENNEGKEEKIDMKNKGDILFCLNYSKLKNIFIIFNKGSKLLEYK